MSSIHIPKTEYPISHELARHLEKIFHRSNLWIHQVKAGVVTGSQAGWDRELLLKMIGNLGLTLDKISEIAKEPQK